MTHAQIGVYLPILNESRKPPMPADLGLVSVEPAVLVAGLLKGAEGASGVDGVLWAVVAAVVVAVVVAEGMGSAILALRAESNIGRIHWEGLRAPLPGKACVRRAQIKLVTPQLQFDSYRVQRVHHAKADAKALCHACRPVL